MLMKSHDVFVHELNAAPDAPLAVFYDTTALSEKHSQLLRPGCEKLAELACAFALVGEPDKPIAFEHQHGGVQVAITETFDDIRERERARLNQPYAEKVVEARHPDLDSEAKTQMARTVLSIAYAGMHGGERSAIHADSELVTGMVERYLNNNLPRHEQIAMRRVQYPATTIAIAA